MDGTLYGRKDYVLEMTTLMDKLTVADVNRAIKKYWQFENFYVAIVSDSSEIPSLVASLKSNKPTPIIYQPAIRKGLGKDILEEDAVIAALPLRVSKVDIRRDFL